MVMDANAFRHLYEYHFAENNKIWKICLDLLDSQHFIHTNNYSHGSVRDQLIHLTSVDEVWFCELQGKVPADPPEQNWDIQTLRSYRDSVEQGMRNYLQQLSNDMLTTKPIIEPEEDRDLVVWQVLFHVINHATDHRAQILRQLYELGYETSDQDYVFFAYDNLVAS